MCVCGWFDGGLGSGVCVKDVFCMCVFSIHTAQLMSPQIDVQGTELVVPHKEAAAAASVVFMTGISSPPVFVDP